MLASNLNGGLGLRIPRHSQPLVVMWLTAHETKWQRGVHCAKEDWDTTKGITVQTLLQELLLLPS